MDAPAIASGWSTALHLPLPAYTTARLQSADLTQISATEFRADAVITLDTPEQATTIITDIQRRPDDDKRFSWPVYLTTLRERLRSPVILLVISPSRRTAAWSSEPIDTGHPGFTLRPFTIGPDQIPYVTDGHHATKAPELALLSAIAHGRQPDRHATLAAAVAAITSLPKDQGKIYYDIVLAALPRTARRYLESLMATTDYQFQSEFALDNQAKGKAEGKAEGEAKALLTILAARGITVSDSVRQRITSCLDLTQLESWITKALTIRSADELLT